MKTYKVDLYDYFGVERKGATAGTLDVILHTEFAETGIDRKRPAMLVLGGGGYAFVSDREKEPVAVEFFAKGFNCFILQYSVAPVTFPASLIEACMAAAYIKQNAEELHVIYDKVAGVGFSAGGHLLGMLSTMYNAKEVKQAIGDKDCKIDAAIFSYAVVSTKPFAHKDSFNNLSGGDENIVKRVSIEDNVNKDTPPAFIWCTANDDLVPSENSLVLAMAYKKAGVPFELHVFENGVHGLSICTKECNAVCTDTVINPEVARWTELAEAWLKKRNFK